ncbi:MFS transporter, partial [Peribacillus frigoritolerans]
MPIYLVKEKGVDLIAAGGLLAIPYIFGFLMFNVSGWLLDKHMANREKYLAAAGALLSAIFLFLMS